MTKYSAIWQVENAKLRVFPRTKKTSFFKTVETAARELEKQAKKVSFDSRGLVYDTDGNLVLTIAL